MPIPVSLTTISTFECTRSTRTCTRPPFGVNLTAFEKQVADDLLQTGRVARHEAGARVDDDSIRTPLESAAGRTVDTAS